MLAAAAEILDLVSYQQAMASPEWEHWKHAVDEEYASVMVNHTWKLEDLLVGHKSIEDKWLFRRKFKPDGSVDRYKARYVVRGFKQINEVDYLEEELFSPVVRISTHRVRLSAGHHLSCIRKD